MTAQEAKTGNRQPETGNFSNSPPFFTSWSQIYAAVLSFLALLIVLFYIFMKTFS